MPEVIVPPVCPYCEGIAVLRDSAILYKVSYGYVWLCPNWPKCDSYVGCHKKTKTPIGSLANQKLRRLRSATHKVFDPLWKKGEGGKLSRSEAYKWLAETLELSKENCHIGMFDFELCERAILACKERV